MTQTKSKKSAKKIFFHGTSADNLESILKHGISHEEPKLWNCSNDEVYLWSCDKLVELGECDNVKDAEYCAFQRAYESAQIACISAKDCRAVVIKIELPINEIYEDESCEDMKHSGCACIGRTILPTEILEIKVSNDLSMLKGYFIALMLENKYFDQELSQIEKKIGEVFKKAEIHIEDIEDSTQFESVNLKQLKIA